MSGLFSTAVDITLKGYTKADGSSFLAAERQALADFLRNAGLQDRLAAALDRHAARLADGSIYTGYTGTGAEDRARQFVDDMEGLGQKAGLIGDTDWGTYIKENSQAQAIKDEFGLEIKAYAEEHWSGNLLFDGRPLNGSAAVQDMMWNYGITVTLAITPNSN